MFHNHDAGMIESGGRICEPKLEDMLAECRKMIEACNEAEQMLFRLAELPIYIRFSSNRMEENGHEAALGSIGFQRRQAIRRETEILKRMEGA